MRLIKHIARIVFGIAFIFAGFVKGVDPWGSAYKFTDYFNAMGLESFQNMALPLGVILAFAEFAIGVAFLFNWRMRFFSWLGLFFMLFFTPLTLWIALKNPVTDCGCFGDALVISNWETFYKNIVLIALAILVFTQRNWFEKQVKSKFPLLASLLSFAIYLFIVWYSYSNLPILDFRPYKVGTNIPEAMSIPEGAPQEIYENTFFYKNKGTEKIQKFSEDNYPWQDTANWVYHDMESVLVQKGYEPPIHNFNIETPDGENVTDFFIHDENYVFLLIAYDLNKTSTKKQGNINLLAEWAAKNGFSFVCLTSSLSNQSIAFAEEHNASYEFLNCDEVTLKTMIRSNPGLIVLKSGNIVGKWHYNNIPTPKKFQENYMK